MANLIEKHRLDRADAAAAMQHSTNMNRRYVDVAQTQTFIRLFNIKNM